MLCAVAEDLLPQTPVTYMSLVHPATRAHTRQPQRLSGLESSATKIKKKVDTQYSHKGHTARCSSQLARHKKSKFRWLHGTAKAGSVTCSRQITQSSERPSSKPSFPSVLSRHLCRSPFPSLAMGRQDRDNCQIIQAKLAIIQSRDANFGYHSRLIPRCEKSYPCLSLIQPCEMAL